MAAAVLKSASGAVAVPRGSAAISFPMFYAVTYEGDRVGSVESLRGSRRTRWIARPADGNDTALFPTRRDATAWLIARHREQREREA